MSSTLVFNEAYYLSQYADVRAAVAAGLITAKDHWEQFGWREERNPNAEFNTAFYASNNADVVAAKVNYLDHYLANGAAEGRLPNSAWTGTDLTKFDSAAYLAAYPDVAAAGVNALSHYMLFGRFENRTAQLTDGTAIGAATGGTGQTFTLTVGVDTNTGTLANEIFDGSFNAQGVATFQSFDSLNGDAGYDTVVAQNPGNISTNANTLKNIESLQVLGLTAASTIALANTTGLEDIQIANALGGVNVSGINAGIKTLGITGNPANGADAYVLTAANTATAGSTDEVTLNLSGVGNSTNNDTVTIQPTSGVNGFETISVNATAGSFVTLNDGAATTLTTVKSIGAADLTLTVTPATLTSFDASAAAGAQTVDLSTNTQNITVKGGAGNDTLRIGNLTKSDVIDGGAGANTLRFAAAGTTLTDTFQVTNIQTLRIEDALNASLDVSKFGTAVNTVRLDVDSATSRTISKLAADSTIDVRAAQSAAVVHTLSLANATGSADKVTVALNGDYSGGGATALNYRQFKADNVESLVLKSGYTTGGNPENVGDLATVSFDAAQAKELTITGTIGVTVTGAAGGAMGANLTTINSTGLVSEITPTSTVAGSIDGGISLTLGTGANQTATVTTGNGNNAIVSAAGSDKLVFGNGVDTATIGTGNDNVNFGAGNDFLLLTGATDLTKDDVIAGGDGTDIIRISAAQTVTDDAFTGVTGFERIEATGGVAIALNLGTNAANAFTNAIRIDQAATASQSLNVNGSALTSTQTLDVRGAAATAATADIIVGGAGADKITGGINSAASGDNLTGGGGADIFYFRTLVEGTGGAIAGTEVVTTELDKITDFSAGVDKVQLGINAGAFAAGVTFTSSTVANVTVVADDGTNRATLAAVTTALEAASAGTATTAATAQVALFSNVTFAAGATPKTFLVVNNATAAWDATTDYIIELTGVTGTVSAGDFVFGDLYA